MKKQQLTFICTQLGVTDYLSWSDHYTFVDLIKNLKNKYESEVIIYMKKNFQNIRKNISLSEITIKLHYFDEEGKILTIGNLTKVKDLISLKVNRIYWDPEPIGGIKNR